MDMKLDSWTCPEREKSEEELIWGQLMSLVWNKSVKQNTYISGSLSVVPEKQHQPHLGTC